MEAALVAADVRVTSCSVYLILHSLSGTTLTSTSRDVLRTHLRLLKAKCPRALSRCRIVHYRKTTAVLTNVSVSTSAIGVVYFGAPSACKYAHYFCFVVEWIIGSMAVGVWLKLINGLSYLYI